MTLEYRSVLPTNKSDYVMIMLHGLGDSGLGMIGLANDFCRTMKNNFAYVAPDAPYRHPFVDGGFQWFDIVDIFDESRILRDMQPASGRLHLFIDQVLHDYGISEDKLILMGFSQGAMMALYVGLRRKKACAAILAYSGALVGRQVLNQEMSVRVPVCIIHGALDGVLPAFCAREAAEALKVNDVPYLQHVLPNLDHAISFEGIRLGCDFILKNIVRE